MKITELERNTLKVFQDNVMSEIKQEPWYPDQVIGILNTYRAYQLSLYVKYDMDVNGYDVSIKTGEFTKRLKE